jgi:hypothetical protein
MLQKGFQAEWAGALAFALEYGVPEDVDKERARTILTFILLAGDTRPSESSRKQERFRA